MNILFEIKLIKNESCEKLIFLQPRYTQGGEMRECPRCNKLMFTNRRIFIDTLLPFLPMTCTNCHCIPINQREDLEFLPDLISGIFSEIIFVVILLISLFTFGNIWVGLSIFIVYSILKSWYISKGILVDPEIV